MNNKVTMEYVQHSAYMYLGCGVPSNWFSLSKPEKVEFIKSAVSDKSADGHNDPAYLISLIKDDAYRRYWRDHIQDYPVGYTYFVACTKWALEKMGAMTIEGLESFIEVSTVSECKEHLHFYSSIDDRDCHKITHIDKRYQYSKELSGEDYMNIKYAFTEKVWGDDIGLYLECERCGRGGGFDFHQTADKLDSFSELTEGIYCCNSCPGAPVEVYVSHQNED